MLMTSHNPRPVTPISMVRVPRPSTVDLITAELRSAIFDPYVTHTAGGTGLGLAIVKKIVVEHGGTIDVDDSPLGGARISIVLPFDDSGEQRSEARGERRPLESGGLESGGLESNEPALGARAASATESK